MDLHTIEANGLRLRVALSGKGPLIVLIHGFPEGWYSWSHQEKPAEVNAALLEFLGQVRVLPNRN